VDDNANLSHENPGPEETCDVGAIEKLAYDLWLARGCPVGCPEVDWFDAERQLNGTRESPASPDRRHNRNEEAV
jgi:hypothetical protein